MKQLVVIVGDHAVTCPSSILLLLEMGWSVEIAPNLVFSFQIVRFTFNVHEKPLALNR